jgi:hypothetical protein
MTKWIGAAILALGLMFGGPVPVTAAAAAPSQPRLQQPQSAKASDISARRYTRHYTRYAYRRAYAPYYPTYYDRPYYYAPAPYVPFNFGYPLLPPPWW